MIIFDLRCDKGHKYEGWFKDRAAFDEQQTKKLITCPICGTTEVVMVPSSISVMLKDGNAHGKSNAADMSPMKYLQSLHQYIESNFDNVGDRFADIALKIHHGEEDQRNIRGTTTTAEEETLRQEGVFFIKIPEPKFNS
ncbi:MAG: hypothetical protein CSYNP_02172 [Syntrophus sp. SKADARSKE-3]|nr:hypothetical protein [Syntrophus sp. SKADARSKE-3]